MMKLLHMNMIVVGLVSSWGAVQLAFNVIFSICKVSPWFLYI